ncbi:YciI family protein [Streptomyces cinnamoneus]|uniref:YciI family protein n=1 Tax=Streptomyces cinnamoneus TaxID=53446 RepID=UPI00341F56EC
MPRFMMIVKASEDSEAGVLPTREMLTEMGQYNDQLVQAGAWLTGDGLRPTSDGARVTYSGGAPVVTEGPFGPAKDQVAGFWVIRAPSMDEALEWARRIPFREGEVEVRRLFEAEDFPAQP